MIPSAASNGAPYCCEKKKQHINVGPSLCQPISIFLHTLSFFEFKFRQVKHMLLGIWPNQYYLRHDIKTFTKNTNTHTATHTRIIAHKRNLHSRASPARVLRKATMKTIGPSFGSDNNISE